jgi:hypothetical protein
MASTHTSTQPEAQQEQIARLERGLRNVGFEVERQERDLGARLEALEQQLTDLGAARRQAAEEPAGSPAAGAVELRELKALRRQVAELQRSVAEVRQLGLSRKRRRAAVKRVLGAPFRVVAAPFRRTRPATARPRPTPPLKRRLARLPRRTRLRIARLLRRPKLWIRERLFARRLGRLNHHDPKELKIPRRYWRQRKLATPPVISIVTPSFNQGHFLDRTIRSVVEQEYPRLEYIVQDGGSSDDTKHVLERHAESLHHYEMRDDDGHAHAINLGFAHASGEVMAFLNSDDLLLPGSLHYVARYFERHPDVDAVYGHRVLIDENDMEIGRWVLPRHNDEILSWADFVPQETLFWRRDIWEKAGASMDQQWPFALDWDLLIRLRDAGARMVRLPRFLGAFRIHKQQKTSAIMDTQGQKEASELRKRMHGREVSRPEISAAVKPYMRRHLVLQKLYRARLLRY